MAFGAQLILAVLQQIEALGRSVRSVAVEAIELGLLFRCGDIYGVILDRVPEPRSPDKVKRAQFFKNIWRQINPPAIKRKRPGTV